jgi:hypothetical protein
LQINELTVADMDRCVDACTLMLQQFPTMAQKAKVLFMDECVIYRSSRSRTVFFWGKEEPHFFEKAEHNPPHVIIWAGMTASHLFRSYFLLAL